MLNPTAGVKNSAASAPELPAWLERAASTSTAMPQRSASPQCRDAQGGAEGWGCCCGQVTGGFPSVKVPEPTQRVLSVLGAGSCSGTA